jgi:hypothetical protein
MNQLIFIEDQMVVVFYIDASDESSSTRNGLSPSIYYRLLGETTYVHNNEIGIVLMVGIYNYRDF